MNRWTVLYALLALLLLAAAGCAKRADRKLPERPGPIEYGLVLVDGRETVPMAELTTFSDPRGDSDVGVDFDTVGVIVEDGRVIFRVRTKYEIGLQNGSGLVMLLDRDGDPETGLDAYAGAETVWEFGRRRGTMVREDGDPVEFFHNQVNLVTAPTVTSSLFEIAFSLDAAVESMPLIGDRGAVGVAFYDKDNGDRIPDSGFFELTVDGPGEEAETIGVAKTDDDAVRLVAWNVLFDGIVERPEAFDRVFDVLQPQIVVLSEVWDTPANEAARLMNEWRPLDGDNTWQAAKQGADIIALSQWPILDSWPIEGARAGAFLLHMPAPWDKPLFVVGAHPPCCGKNEERQLEIDAIMAFVRSAREGSGPARLPEGTPIVITGDMNLVGYDEQLETFVKGEIRNISRFGKPFGPDSDGSQLTDLFPRHLQDMLVYTWRADDSSYGPGKLDYVIYGDADIAVQHSFVFDTRLLSGELLGELGLDRDASPAASDHLPVVADLMPVGDDGESND